jgi:hypothetical protein
VATLKARSGPCCCGALHGAIMSAAPRAAAGQHTTAES